MISRTVAYALALALVVVGALATVQTLRLKNEQLAHQQTRVQHAELISKINEKTQATLLAVREAERLYAAAVADIMSDNQKALEDAQATYDADLARLRDGTLQLQERWRGCAARTDVPGAAAGAGGTTEADNGRYESAGRAVRAAEQCDANNAALIRIVVADRALCNGKPMETP